MEYQELRSIFAHTINPDASKRKQAEDTLRSLECKEDFILSLPTTLMADNDMTVRKVSTIFFKNSVQRNWKSEPFKKQIMKSVTLQMSVADKATLVYYKEILRFIFSNEAVENLEDILKTIPEYMGSEDPKKNYIAITILLLIQDSDVLRYNKSVIYPMVDNVGQLLVNRLVLYLEKQEYFLSALIMKYIAKMSKQYNMPPSLSELGCYTGLFQVSKNTLKLSGDSKDLMKLKKWALRFLYKSTHKALKKFHKEVAITDFIAQKDVISEIYGLCRDIVYMNAHGKVDYEKMTVSAVEYIFLLLEEKDYFPLIVNDTSFYLSSLVLKSHMFDDKVEVDFEDYPDNYLKQKYSYYSNDLKTVSGSFFTTLVKKLKKQPSYFDSILNYLISVITSMKNAPSDENASLCYGALYLTSLISHHIVGAKKGEVGDFLIDYVFSFLSSDYVYLQSQACYTLQFFDGSLVNNDAIFSCLERICELLKSQNDILKVDAAHSMAFFFSNDMVQPKLSSLIPEIVHTLISMNNKYNLESLSDILENLVSNYPDQIMCFAPKLTEALIEQVCQNLIEYNDDKLMLIAGYLRTISGMVSSIEDKPVLAQMFKTSFSLIVKIFQEKRSDFYQESIDMMVNYLYSMKFIDESMWFIFGVIMRVDDGEISNNIDEITNLVDNYISFGKEKVLSPEYFGLIIKFIESVCLVDQDGFFDDDHNCGCKIMESLLLNNGSLLSEHLESFIGYSIYNKSFFEKGSSSWVYSLNVIMHCFVTNPTLTTNILQNKAFYEEFFDKIFENIGLFSRVHDKKTIVLFLGVLCGQPALDLEYRKVAKVLVTTLKTLPDAISKRNNEKNKEETTESPSCSENEEDFSDYNDDMLDEDIYFETVLDSFDPFPYVLKILNSPTPNSVCEKLIGSLNKSQKEVLQKILSQEQPKQK